MSVKRYTLAVKCLTEGSHILETIEGECGQWVGALDYAALEKAHEALKAKHARVVEVLKQWWDDEGGTDDVCEALLELGFIEPLPPPALMGYRWVEGKG